MAPNLNLFDFGRHDRTHLSLPFRRVVYIYIDRETRVLPFVFDHELLRVHQL